MKQGNDPPPNGDPKPETSTPANADETTDKEIPLFDQTIPTKLRSYSELPSPLYSEKLSEKEIAERITNLRRATREELRKALSILTIEKQRGTVMLFTKKEQYPYYDFLQKIGEVARYGGINEIRGIKAGIWQRSAETGIHLAVLPYPTSQPKEERTVQMESNGVELVDTLTEEIRKAHLEASVSADAKFNPPQLEILQQLVGQYWGLTYEQLSRLTGKDEKHLIETIAGINKTAEFEQYQFRVAGRNGIVILTPGNGNISTICLDPLRKNNMLTLPRRKPADPNKRNKSTPASQRQKPPKLKRTDREKQRQTERTIRTLRDRVEELEARFGGTVEKLRLKVWEQAVRIAELEKQLAQKDSQVASPIAPTEVASMESLHEILKGVILSTTGIALYQDDIALSPNIRVTPLKLSNLLEKINKIRFNLYPTKEIAKPLNGFTEKLTELIEIFKQDTPLTYVILKKAFKPLLER